MFFLQHPNELDLLDKLVHAACPLKTYRYQKERQLKKYNFAYIIHFIRMILYVVKVSLCVQSVTTQLYLNPFTINLKFMFPGPLVPKCTHLSSERRRYPCFTETFDVKLHYLIRGKGSWRYINNDPSDHWLIITTCQQSRRKVMFSVVCICIFIERVPSDHYVWCIGLHDSETPRHAQTCSTWTSLYNLFPQLQPPPPLQGFPVPLTLTPPPVQFASGRFASYWNAFSLYIRIYQEQFCRSLLS